MGEIDTFWRSESELDFIYIRSISTSNLNLIGILRCDLNLLKHQHKLIDGDITHIPNPASSVIMGNESFE